MESPMSEWNNDRLDELNGRINDGFAKVDERFAKVDERFAKVDERFVKVDDRFVRLEGEMREGFAKVDERFKEVDARFDKTATREEIGEVNVELHRLNDRFDRLLYTLMAIAWGFAGTVLAAIVGLIAVVLV